MPGPVFAPNLTADPVTGLGKQLGCERDQDGYLIVDANGATTVPGVFAAGDVTPGLQLVQVAAGSGATAGVGCALSLENDPRTPAARKASRSASTSAAAKA